MNQYTEGCRRLTGPVPLRKGERHCPYCAGYGAQPIPPNVTQCNPHTCWECGGTGKETVR